MQNQTDSEKKVQRKRGRRENLVSMPPGDQPDATPEVTEAPPEPPEPPEPPINGETAYSPLLDAEEDGDQPAPSRPGRPKTGEYRVPSVSFFEKWNATPNFTEDAEYWVWRIEPITDRVSQGKAKFIQVWHEPMDENKLMTTCGSGVYKIMVKTRSGSVMSLRATLERLEIENMDYPPRIEPGDWLEDHRNRRWAWAKKHYDADAAKASGLGATANMGLTAADILTVVDRALESRMPAGATDKTVLEAVRTGMEMSKASAPARNDDMVTILRDQMNALRAENADLHKRFLDILAARAADPAAPRKSAAEELRDSIELIKGIREALPSRGGGSGPAPEQEHPGWGILRDIAQGLAPALGVIAQQLLTRPPQAAQTVRPVTAAPPIIPGPSPHQQKARPIAGRRIYTSGNTCTRRTCAALFYGIDEAPRWMERR